MFVYSDSESCNVREDSVDCMYCSVTLCENMVGSPQKFKKKTIAFSMNFMHSYTVVKWNYKTM